MNVNVRIYNYVLNNQNKVLSCCKKHWNKVNGAGLPLEYCRLKNKSFRINWKQIYVFEPQDAYLNVQFSHFQIVARLTLPQWKYTRILPRQITVVKP